MDAAKLQSIKISENRRQRSQGAFRFIILAVILATAAALYVAKPWASDTRTTGGKEAHAGTRATTSAETNIATPPREKPAKAGDAVLTVSGYIINRERIEISPRTMNEVKWIGVKKGDR